MSSSEQNLSKRERQKQRRDAKLAAQRVQEQRSRRTRLLVFVLLGVIFVGLIGAAVANQRRQAAELAQQEADAIARLDELGCTEDLEQEDAGQGHLDAATLGDRAPDTLYPNRPATSGEHYSSWMITGVYDELIDERALVHNLEHGYIVAYYDEGAEQAQVDDLKTYAQTQIDGSFPKVIVAPWDGDLPEDANFAYTAWGFRQMCSEFDQDVYEVFTRKHHSNEGIAPEKTLPPHLNADSGIDPEGEPFLLPPLGEAEAPEGVDEEGNVLDPSEGASDAADTSSEAPAEEAPTEATS